MLNTKTGIFLLAGFVAGAFFASPELRAYAANTVFSTDIVDGEVKTADLANNAVKTGKISDGTITSADIADGTINTLDIGFGAIGISDIAAGAVTSSHIVDGNIVAQDIGTSQIITAKIADGAVTNSKLGSLAVTNSKIGNFEVTNSKLSSNSVTSDKIAADTITEDDISPSFMKWVTLNDGQNGWNPDDGTNVFPISDPAAGSSSVILASVDNSNLGNSRWVSCGVTDLQSGLFILACANGVVQEGAQLQYILFNP